MTDAKFELLQLLEEEELKRTTLLVLANKQDMPGAATSAEVEIMKKNNSV